MDALFEKINARLTADQLNVFQAGENPAALLQMLAVKKTALNAETSRLVSEFMYKRKAAERADKREAAEREAAAAAAEAAAAAAEREAAAAAAERAERADKRRHEERMAGKNISTTSSPIAQTTSELYHAKKPTPWRLHATEATYVCKCEAPLFALAATYTDAVETIVQAEMNHLMRDVADEYELMYIDTHAGGVHGLLKPDGVLVLLACPQCSAPAVAVVVEYKARRSITSADTFAFSPDEQGEMINYLARLRFARPGELLYGVLTNGFHYQLFMASPSADKGSLDNVSASAVFKLSVNIGPLKKMMQLAAESIATKFGAMMTAVRSDERFMTMNVCSVLGSGAQCHAYEIVDDDTNKSHAVVVAQTVKARGHLLHSFDVFSALHKSADKCTPLYTPLRAWSNAKKSKAVCVFGEVGKRWTVDMFRARWLTRQDFVDIAKQIEHFHKNDYIHADVALRNLVRYQEHEGGAMRSVLIDAGAAVKAGEKWRGGTINNAAISWLKKNWDGIIERFASGDENAPIDVPTKQEELWSFVFAALDLCYPHERGRAKLVAFREEQVAFPAVKAIGELVEALDYDGVANAVADLLCLGTLTAEKDATCSPGSSQGLRTTVAPADSPPRSQPALTSAGAMSPSRPAARPPLGPANPNAAPRAQHSYDTRNKPRENK